MYQVEFSVIMPVYNKEKGIKRSIESVLKQNYQNFELIIVCDPSTDNSLAEINKFTDPRIKILNRNIPGPGGYAARNMGIKNATAKWIAFLDADDEWYPNHLKYAKNIISDNEKVSFVFFNYDVLFNKQKRTIHKITDNKILNKLDLLKFYSYQALMNTNSILVKRDLLIDTGGFPEGKVKRGGDSDLWLRLMLKCNYAIWGHESTSCYHMDDSGVIKNPNTLGNKHLIYDTVNEYLNNKKITSEDEKKYLYKISNRKSFEVSIARKRYGLFKYKELYVYNLKYFEKLDYIKYLLILMPSFISRIAYKIKTYVN